MTGNWALHARTDEDELTLKNVIETHLARPLVMLVTEPVIFSLALYNAFVYGSFTSSLKPSPIEYEE